MRVSFPVGIASAFAFIMAVWIPESGTARILDFFPVEKRGFALAEGSQDYTAVCPFVRMKSRDEFEFGAMETRLLCGDPEEGVIGEPWKEIPASQAAYFMKGFLQSRGYHKPTFLQDGAVLFVDPGPLSRLESFRVTGGPETWSPPKRRLVRGNRLTPSLLDDLQGWVLTQIKNEGYACATVESRADPEVGLALVHLSLNGLRTITKLETTGDTGLREDTLNRYNAFHVGDIYREYLISLTRQRTVEDGFLQTLLVSVRCDDDGGVTIVRDVILGPSRVVRVGAGGSSEAGARLRAIVRQNRIGSTASTAQATVNLSYLNEQINQQVLDSRFRWYYSPGEVRSFVEPALLFEHRAEGVYAVESIEGKVLHGWGRELGEGLVEVRVGPTFLESNLIRGQGVGESSLVYAEVSGRWLSHKFEYFAVSPREGSYAEVSLAATQERWGANFTAQRAQIQGQKLWNIYRYDPPLLILGVRYDLSSVFSPNPNITSDLPVRFLTFAGGERDLRGFARASLPRSGAGALSGALGSFEGRFHRVLFRRVDIFGFVDAGALGGVRFQLRRPLFMSPGLGLRWESPLGVLRVYGAQRFALFESEEDPSYGKDWRLGFTFGEEF